VSDGSVWYFGKLFAGSLPIQARPALSINENGGVNVYFGTGRYLDGTDVSDTTPQKFYGVRDDRSWSIVTESDLAAVESVFVDSADRRGWYFPLENGNGERVIEPSIAVEGVVYFTSFRPDTAACSGGGTSYLYMVDYERGTPIDKDEDGELGDESRSQTLGSGVASRPVVDLAREEIIVQTSDARLNINDMVTRPRRIQVRAWRERFDATLAQPQTQPED
jgi:type IV pilus assembly protein PilY1